MSSSATAKSLAILATAVLLGGCAAGPPSAGLASRDDDQFRRVERGMGQEEVRRIFGAPDEAMRFPRSGTEAWDYRYQDDWGYLAVFSVTFDAQGRAVGTLSRRINAGGDQK